MGQITSLFARKMVAAAGDAVDPVAMLKIAGLGADDSWDPRVMISDASYYEMLERMADLTDVTTLPITVGASMRSDEYGALGLAWKAAPDLHGSLSRVVRYARLWTSVVAYELRPVPQGMLYILNRSGARRLGLRLSNEATLASTVSMARQSSTKGVRPVEVLLRHRAPRRIDAHEAYFECPVRFDAPMDALLWSQDTLAIPNRLGDPGITDFLLPHLDAELAQLADTPSLVGQTKDAIARALSDGLPRMADIARDMGLSARSFHRKLAEDGASFQTLTEETRRELALALLRDESHSIAEVAFLTGFSEQSAFTRAFKRWVGQTPAQYKRHLPD